MGSGTPVVMLHSALSSKLQWYRLIQRLSKRYLTIAVDLYGSGDSPYPPSPETFCLSDEVNLVESLLEKVIPGNAQFHLVGHSYGGAVALRMAYKIPERVKSLALFEPVAFHLIPPNETLYHEVRKRGETIKKMVEEGKLTEATEHFVDYWSGSGAFSRFSKDVQTILVEGVKKLPLNQKALIEEPLTLDEYRFIRTPVLLMAGLQSPPDSRHLVELLSVHLPNCRVQMVNGGHMAPVNMSDPVNTLIESFINNL